MKDWKFNCMMSKMADDISQLEALLDVLKSVDIQNLANAESLTSAIRTAHLKIQNIRGMADKLQEVYWEEGEEDD